MSEFTSPSLILWTGLALPLPLAALVWSYFAGHYLLAVIAAFCVGLIVGTFVLAYTILDVVKLGAQYQEVLSA